ncbi:MAG: hypothetical protein JSV03_13410 [Planctomycetota bacterium]|nr:MAG: hypothetical protein JSV03_13410 [Planctomycetota bacterium]
MAKKFTPTETQIRKSVLGVCYEIDQMIGAFSKCCETTDTIIKNACLESSLIHTRILRDFFNHTKRNKDYQDVLAIDFGFPECLVTLPDGVNERLNKDLAHLTYQSVERPLTEKKWNPQDFKDLFKCCKEFCEFLLKKNWLDESARCKLSYLHKILSQNVAEQDGQAQVGP